MFNTFLVSEQRFPRGFFSGMAFSTLQVVRVACPSHSWFVCAPEETSDVKDLVSAIKTIPERNLFS